MIYLDNAATTFHKPKIVKDAVINAINKLTANPGRSAHKLSQDAAISVYTTRQKVADFFNQKNTNNIIFSKNCTEALNVAIFGTAKKGGHIITTALEHNSMLRPLFKLKNDGIIELTILNPNEDGVITAEMFEKSIQTNTYMIACTHISNVTGALLDINSIGRLCKQKNLIFLVDGAQSVGHETIDLQKSNVNLFCFSGHKGLYSLTGVGVLIINGVNVNPLILGGTGTQSTDTIQPKELPEGLESGTLPTLSIISLGAGIDFVKNNFVMFKQKIKFLTDYLTEKLNGLKFIKKYYNPNNCHGVVSFNIQGINSAIVCDELSEKYEIYARSGLHCAPLVHQFQKTTYSGAVRVSLSPLNTKYDIDELLFALKEIKEKYDYKNKNIIL